jgi:hypothetical protein
MLRWSMGEPRWWWREANHVLPDEVGPEAVSSRRRGSVQVEDSDQSPQQSGGPVIEWLRIDPIE